MDNDDCFQNLRKAAYEILTRKGGSLREDTIKTLAAFVTSAEPDFFEDSLSALNRHLERLLALIESQELTPTEAAYQLAGLIAAASRRDIDRLIAIDPEWSRTAA